MLVKSAKLRSYQQEIYMATRIFYPDGTTEVIPESIGSDENYINGTYDFFDVNGKLLRQIPMDSRITWQPENEPVIENNETE